MKKSFILYTDSFEMLQHLSDEQLGRLTRLLFNYQLNGSTPEVSDPLFFPFGFIRASMDRDNEKWEQRAERARINGTKGGRPKDNQDGLEETQKTQSVILEPTKPVNVTVSVNDNVNVNGSVSVIYPDSIESNHDTIKPDQITIINPAPEKKKVAPKKKGSKHLFTDSIYFDNIDQFIADWNKSKGATDFNQADPIIIYHTLQNSSNANGYKYIDWIAAAYNWVKRNPNEYKRKFITPAGDELHHKDQAMLERLERLNRNYT